MRELDDCEISEVRKMIKRYCLNGDAFIGKNEFALYLKKTDADLLYLSQTDTSVVKLTSVQSLTNKTINGVTLSSTGSALLFLNQQGNYVAVSGGGGGTTTNPLTIGTGLTGTSFDGSSVVTIAIDSTVATLSGIQTLTNKTISGATNTLTAIGNGSLVNSAITIGATSVSLGATATALTGLTSVSSTAFVGALTGNASTATALQTARTINGISFDGTANITVTAASPNALTIGTGLIGASYNGSTAVTIAIDGTVATLSGIQTLTNKTISGAANTLTNIGNGSLVNSSVTIGTTPVSLGSAVTSFTGLTSISSTAFVGALTGNSTTATALQTARTINGTSFDGTANITITAVNPNALTIGTGLSGTSYNGSSSVTIAIDSTVVTTTGVQALTNKSVNGVTLSSSGSSSLFLNQAGTYSTPATGGGAGTTANPLTIGAGLTGTSFNGSAAITIAIDSSVVTLTGTQSLTNKTVNGVVLNAAGSSSLFLNQAGGYTTPSGSGTTTNTLTIGTGLTGTSFNGSAAVTIAIDSTVATLTGLQTLTNKTISGAANTLTNIGNGSLTNSSVTIGATSVSLGATVTAFVGLTSVTSTAFVGALTGNATTATTLQTGRSIYGNSFNGSADLTQIIASTFGGTGNGFTKFSGPTTSEKTFTLPNASATILTTNAAVTEVQGGTGIATYTLGDTLYSSATNTLAKLAGNTSTTKLFLSQTGNGTVSAAPVWSAVSKADVGLGSVENTALSTWAGSTNITTLGTITTTSPIAPAYGGTGLSSLGSGIATFLGTPNSANLLAAIPDETGSGALVFATLPTFGSTGVRFAGSTSGAITLVAAAVAGANTLTMPATTGTLVTTGDTGSVTNTMLAGSIANAKLANSTISGVALGSNLNTLTIGTGLSGTSYNGSAGVTIAIDGTVVTTTGIQILTNKTVNGVTLDATGSSSLFLNQAGTYSAPGGGGGTTTNALTIGTGLTGTSFNGSAAVTIAIDSTVATLSGIQTLTNKTISGASNTITNIGNGSLTNNSVTIGATSVSLGATVTTFTGLSSVTSTTFVGALTGNASTATTLQTARSIYGNSFNGSADLTQIIASTFGGTGNGFTKFSGPATTEKTFTLPNASATILTSAAAVTEAQGGTNQTTYAQGDILYASAINTLAKLAKSTTATRYLANTGTSNAPAWDQVNLTNGVTGNLPVTNLNSGTSASSTTYWTGNGTWTTPTGLISGLTSGYVPRATGATSLGNGTIQDNGTQVGIGQSPNASYRLAINGASYVTPDGNAVGIYFNGTSAFRGSASLYFDGDFGGVGGEIYFRIGNLAAYEAIRISGASSGGVPRTMFTGGIKLNPSGAMSTPSNGAIYYDSTTHIFKGYANGVWVNFH